MLKLFNPKSFAKPWKAEKFAVACSGGFDSMAILDFFVKGGYKPVVLHVNHSTGNDAAEHLVVEYCNNNSLDYIIHKVNPSDKQDKQSWEEFWRHERLEFFKRFNGPVITGHNLNDAMETWLFSSMNGVPKLIPYNTENIYRPFILNNKQKLKDYCVNKNVKWLEDKSNVDVKYSRNRIRHNIMPEVLKINPGFDTMLIKRYKTKYNGE